ncbi:long-chain fatty acid transport protein [Breoghania corrubedonensis]|uniref:Long-chain fatty acid transport protein n=1 Tax=Breoghania corrubedonensis TaxID=665038 RepID=A0A2T5V4P9_9HYPH|nr:outer membrane protein transport protein [Breoghania corrubedonensis]PTW58728.1 long-chain fatty acid transport protein [Breoghania corrubedonensis]
MLKKKHLFLTVSMVALAGGASQAIAGGFALREQSAYYQGTSFAGNAVGGDSISSMFWNPATLTNTIGMISESHHTLIVPNSEITPDSSVATAAFGPSGDLANDAWIPSSYTGYQIDENWYLGLSINTPFGLSTKSGPNWSGQVYARTSEVFSVNVTPTIAYKFNDMISVGLGMQFQYFDVRLTSATNALPGAPTAGLTGDDIGYGFTAGITLTPMKGTEIGLGYRSAVFHDLDGNFSTPVAIGALPAGTYDISAKMATPDMVTLSAKQRITDSFRVMGTIEWTNWSRLKEPAVLLDSGTQLRTLPFNYDDSWFFSVGGEYDWNDKLTLRAGVAYELSPIDENIRSLRLPDSDRVWLSTGLSYKPMENLSLDLGYTYIFSAEDARVNIGPSHQDYAGLTYTGDVDASVNIVSAAVRYTW